jgi:hypothetical protein
MYRVTGLTAIACDLRDEERMLIVYSSLRFGDRKQSCTHMILLSKVVVA